LPESFRGGCSFGAKILIVSPDLKFLPFKYLKSINIAKNYLKLTFYCLFYNLSFYYKHLMKNYLNFETDIKNLESEIEKLKDPYNQEGLSEVDTQKISSTQAELDEKLKDIYSNLDPWQTTMVARHEDRPKSKFFIDNLFDDFIPLSGDRFYGEDKSVITGFAKFNDESVLVIGQEKG